MAVPIEITVSPRKICTKMTTPKVIAAGRRVGCYCIMVTHTTRTRMKTATINAPMICVITPMKS